MSPELEAAALRSKAALHASIRSLLHANEATRNVDCATLAALCDAAAEAAIQAFVTAAPVTINLNVTVTPEK